VTLLYHIHFIQPEKTRFLNILVILNLFDRLNAGNFCIQKFFCCFSPSFLLKPTTHNAELQHPDIHIAAGKHKKPHVQKKICSCGFFAYKSVSES